MMANRVIANIYQERNFSPANQWEAEKSAQAVQESPAKTGLQEKSGDERVFIGNTVRADVKMSRI